jgi:hypothetical protein
LGAAMRRTLAAHCSAAMAEFPVLMLACAVSCVMQQRVYSRPAVSAPHGCGQSAT